MSVQKSLEKANRAVEESKGRVTKSQITRDDAARRLEAFREQYRLAVAAEDLAAARKAREAVEEAGTVLDIASTALTRLRAEHEQAVARQTEAGRAYLVEVLELAEQRDKLAVVAIVEKIKELGIVVRARRELGETTREARRSLYGGDHRDDGSTEALVVATLITFGVLDAKEFRRDHVVTARQARAYDADEQARLATVEGETKRSQELADARALLADAERLRAGWNAKIADAVRGLTGYAAQHRASLAALERRVADAEALLAAA